MVPPVHDANMVHRQWQLRFLRGGVEEVKPAHLPARLLAPEATARHDVLVQRVVEGQRRLCCERDR